MPNESSSKAANVLLHDIINEDMNLNLVSLCTRLELAHSENLCSTLCYQISSCHT